MHAFEKLFLKSMQKGITNVQIHVTRTSIPVCFAYFVHPWPKIVFHGIMEF